MTAAKLTPCVPPATLPVVDPGDNGMGWKRAALAVAVVPALLGGCINVTAPAEPIVIELNINIRQEVIYRLAEDAGNTIDENAGIF